MILKLISGVAIALLRCVEPGVWAFVGVIFMGVGVGMVRSGYPRVAVALCAVGFFLAILRKTPAPKAGPPSQAAAPGKAPVIGATLRSPASRLRAGWCQGAAARDRGGRAVFPRESAAASWSLPGAVAASIESGTPEWTACLRRISQVLGAPSVSVGWLVQWNDDPSRTQADAVAAAEAVEEHSLGRKGR